MIAANVAIALIAAAASVVVADAAASAVAADVAASVVAAAAAAAVAAADSVATAKAARRSGPDLQEKAVLRVKAATHARLAKAVIVRLVPHVKAKRHALLVPRVTQVPIRPRVQLLAQRANQWLKFKLQVAQAAVLSIAAASPARSREIRRQRSITRTCAHSDVTCRNAARSCQAASRPSRPRSSVKCRVPSSAHVSSGCCRM